MTYASCRWSDYEETNENILETALHLPLFCKGEGESSLVKRNISQSLKGFSFMTLTKQHRVLVCFYTYLFSNAA